MAVCTCLTICRGDSAQLGTRCLMGPQSMCEVLIDLNQAVTDSHCLGTARGACCMESAAKLVGIWRQPLQHCLRAVLGAMACSSNSLMRIAPCKGGARQVCQTAVHVSSCCTRAAGLPRTVLPHAAGAPVAVTLWAAGAPARLGGYLFGAGTANASLMYTRASGGLSAQASLMLGAGPDGPGY